MVAILFNSNNISVVWCQLMQGNSKAKEGKENHFLQICARPFLKTTRNVAKVIKGKRACQALFTLCLLGIDVFYIFISFLKTIV